MENNIVYNEEGLATMKNMPDNFIDMVITSPPYDDLRDYGGYSFDFENIAKELFRITKPGGIVVWIVGDATNKGTETGTSFRQALFFKECGFDLYDTMIYQKTGTPFPQKNRYNQIFEYMFVFSKGKPNTFNPIMKKNVTAGSVRNSRKFRNSDGEMIPGFNGKAVNEWGIENNIWIIRNGMYKSSKDIIAFEHPAIFPEELVLKHIITWTNESDIVYDPFMGSGTTAKCSIQLKRNWIGSEISSEYVDIINRRIASVSDEMIETFTTKNDIDNLK
jgi:site-specific DNA-methyltransferase (adenine-specific)